MPKINNETTIFSVSCNIHSEILTIIQSNGAEFVFQLFFAPANLLSDEHLKCAVVHHFQLIYINCAKDYNNPDPTPKHTRNLRLFPNPGLYILRTCLCKCFLSPAPHLPECERVCWELCRRDGGPPNAGVGIIVSIIWL